MSALTSVTNDTKPQAISNYCKATSKTVPGGKFERCVKSFWAFWIVALYMGAVDLILSLFSSPPKIKLHRKYTGQVCVLTGGSGAIGFEILKKLLQLDYTVILGELNIPLLEQKIKILRTNGISTGRVKFFHLDLKSLRSVQNFANQVLTKSETNRIDLLINNAGIALNQCEITEDNLDPHFQVNYLSHFLLTELLLPRIKNTAKVKNEGPCHIINTASCFHRGGSLQFDNLALKNLYIPIICYFDTKLCQVMHAKSMQNQFEAEGVKNVFMYSTHPGCVPTDIWAGPDGTIYSFLVQIIQPLLTMILRDAETAASVVLHPALNRNIFESCGGKYYENGQPKSPNRQAEDAQIRTCLSDISKELVKSFIKG